MAALARQALCRCVFLDQPQQRAQRHLLLELSREHPLDRRHPALDQLGDLVLALTPAPQHVARDDLRIGAARPAHADPHAREIGAAELLLDRLQPVVPGQPAADAGADLAERQVDLVVHDEHALERAA